MCTDWKIEHPGFKTDHNIVSVLITSENMPFIGKGRWAIPVGLLKNQKLKKETQALAKQLQTEVEQVTTENRNKHDPQIALKTFKKDVVELYKNYHQTYQPKLENAIRSLQNELENKGDAPNLTTDEIDEHSKLIAERIEALEKKRRDSAKLLSTARNRLEGETMSKHWARSAKESTPRDTICALRNPLQNPTRQETRTERMAELAKEYHEELLKVDRDPSKEPDEERLTETTANINARLSPENTEKLRQHLNEEEVTAAMMKTANEKAAGLDSIPIELWKMLHQQYKSAKVNERHRNCNITSVLTKVFKDIAENGITAGTAFNKGWMCPIYKKKEADNIANY